MDGGFDGFEVLWAVDQILVPRRFALGKRFGEDGCVLVCRHVVHDWRACPREVARAVHHLRRRRGLLPARCPCGLRL